MAEEKDDERVDKNVVEVHVRKSNTKSKKFLDELKALVAQFPNDVDLITIDVRKEAIEVVPQVEATISKKPTIYRLMKGVVYLIKDETPDRGFETFADVIKSQCHDCEKSGAFSCEALDCSSCTVDCPCTACDRHRPQGLVITRRFPKKVAQEYLIQTTPIIWLTQMRREDVDCLNPNEISRLNSTIMSFVEKSENGVVLFEGLEYLITQNSYEIILKFTQHLHDMIALSKSCIVFLLDPLALEPEEVHLLQRNMTDL